MAEICERCGRHFHPIWADGITTSPVWCTACIFSADDEDDTHAQREAAPSRPASERQSGQ